MNPAAPFEHPDVARPDLPECQRTVRRAARALARAGLVHAYGHCSMRLDESHFLVCAPKPMGTIQPHDQGMVIALDAAFPEEALGEVRIHREIYRQRPDVGAVVRSMPPKTMALSVMARTPRPLHGAGAYFMSRAPLWDDPQLIRTDVSARALASLLGPASAVVMRGNGLVVAAPTLPDAVVLSWYFEDAARIELDCLAASAVAPAIELSADEARTRATRSGRIFERMWDYLTFGDVE